MSCWRQNPSYGLSFWCQVPKCEHFILISIPGKTLLSDVSLRSGSFFANKEQLITVMVTVFCSWHFKRSRKELEKFTRKWIESRWWEERLQESWGHSLLRREGLPHFGCAKSQGADAALLASFSLQRKDSLQCWFSAGWTASLPQGKGSTRRASRVSSCSKLLHKHGRANRNPDYRCGVVSSCTLFKGQVAWHSEKSGSQESARAGCKSASETHHWLGYSGEMSQPFTHL